MVKKIKKKKENTRICSLRFTLFFAIQEKHVLQKFELKKQQAKGRKYNEN
jgi:hypothetical protein